MPPLATGSYAWTAPITAPPLPTRLPTTGKPSEPQPRPTRGGPEPDRHPRLHLRTDAVPRSPVSLGELELLQATLLLGEDDRTALRRSSDVLAPQIEAILDVWYGFVGANLTCWLPSVALTANNQRYLDAVRRRFGRWILDTARAEFDQAWLDYQHEIGVRHTRRGKNRTDGVQAADHIPLRYVLALLVPITTTLKPFLADRGHPGPGRGHAPGLGQGRPAPADPLEPSLCPRG